MANDAQHIEIPGKPIAKARPRFVRRGKFINTYNPQETEEGKWLLSARSQITRVFEGPIKITIGFYFERPKSHFGTGKNSDIIKENAPKRHVTKPDLDNLIKFVLDCLNGEAFLDDRQIITLEAIKEYDSSASTVVTIKTC